MLTKMKRTQTFLTAAVLLTPLLLAVSGQAQEKKEPPPLSPEAKAVRTKLEKGLETIDLLDEYAYQKLVRQSKFGFRYFIGDSKAKMVINKDFYLYEVHFSGRKIEYFSPRK